jgi:hypothetical protein
MRLNGFSVTIRTSSSGEASLSIATMRVRGTMISFATRSANSRTLLSSSSFTSSSTPSFVPISMRYSISSLVTAGAAAPPPKSPNSALVARVTAAESGHRSTESSVTSGIVSIEIRTGWRFASVFGTISPKKRMITVATAVATARAVAALRPEYAA